MPHPFGPEKHITEAVARTIRKKDVIVLVERPENSAHGDYATNIAMKLAPALRRSPLEIANELAAKLRNSEIEKFVDRIEVASPGFINFFLSPRWLQERVPEIIATGDHYGHSPFAIRHKQKIQIEFISANPTGPLTLANGRGGFLGDCLANVLKAAGHNVTREYYVNDSGEQIKKLGWSVLKAAGYSTPYADSELYQGAYIAELTKRLKIPKPKAPASADSASIAEVTSAKEAATAGKANSTLAENVAREASKLMLRDIKRVTRKAGIRFDTWFSERSLYRQGFVKSALEKLKGKRLLEENEGATWLKLASISEPRVVVKANGEPTYVLPDLTYHIEKYDRRKFKRVIDILGADHYGHAKVLSAALEALGYPAPHVILMQLVRLVENGREAKMSKRTGMFVTLEELLDEVGVDVTRWFFIERAPETHMEFDLALAKERSEKNPVFYVQYAHARCSSILRKSNADLRGQRRRLTRTTDLRHSSELALIKELVRLPDVVVRVARTYEAHQLPTYASAVATAFSAFYRDCPVLNAEPEVRTQRLVFVRATQIVLANTLRLMGIRAPETM